MNKLVLAGDIGATKTNIGLFRQGAKGPKRISFCSFSSCRGTPEFGLRVKAFLSEGEVLQNLAAICFGVAGPVRDGYVEATNLGLKLDEKELRKELSCSCLVLVNDLFATAAAIPLLKKDELAVLQPGNFPRDVCATSAVLAPGTGLGMAFLVDPVKPHILASEGGHADFAPRNEDEVELWRYLKLRFGRVSRERLLSGPGLLNIYDWLRQKEIPSAPSGQTPILSEPYLSSSDIVAAADEGETLAVKALVVFVSLLGSVAGDLALTGMAAGGVYLAGGIPAKIISYLRDDQFLLAFRDKGRMASWLEQIPVRVVLNSEAALLGAARIALSLAVSG